MDDNFPKLMKTIKPQIQAAQQIPKEQNKHKENHPHQAHYNHLLKNSNKVTKKKPEKELCREEQR